MNKPYDKYAVIFAVVVIVLFVSGRAGNLYLPFYYDEAWSYATAVFDIAHGHLAIVSGDGNPELTRGHPMLFYFLAALWVKLTGTGTTLVHLFPLAVSVVLLIAIYRVAGALFDKTTAMAAIVLFALLPGFMAQSTLLLPEVMLALWTLLTVYTYFSKKWFLFAVFSVLLVMTKETGMVLIGTLILDKLVLERFFYGDSKGSRRILTRESMILAVPVVTFAIFMIIQNIRYGWYLYPGHLDLAVLNFRNIMGRAWRFTSELLLRQGRLFFLLLSAYAFIRLTLKHLVNRRQAHLLLFSAVFSAGYLIFSSVNFFSSRYLLSIFPFYIIPGSWLITSCFGKSWQKLAAVGILSVIFSYNTFFNYLNEFDTSLGYRNTVLLQKKAVNFAEQMHWQQKPVYTTFLMQYYLTSPDLGYLGNREQPFINVGNIPGNSDIFIFCSNESDPLYTDICKRSDIQPVKRFESKGAWVQIFSRISP